MEVQGQQRLCRPCWPPVISHNHLRLPSSGPCVLCRPLPSSLAPIPGVGGAGLEGAPELQYIKTTAPWSNKQIPCGSAQGYPTSVNNAAFKHQSYAKRLVHRGGDGSRQEAGKRGLDRWDNERQSSSCCWALARPAPTQRSDGNIRCKASINITKRMG